MFQYQTRKEPLLSPLHKGCNYLFPAHVHKQLGAIWTKGDICGHQNPQSVIVVWKFHWQVTWHIGTEGI